MMLLDEPTAGMAHEDVERIAALIKQVSANRTVLMVEHNLSVVSTLSDHITVLARGEVLAQGDYATVSTNPAVIEAYLGRAAWLSALPTRRLRPRRAAARRCASLQRVVRRVAHPARRRLRRARPARW